jgi:ankyrin repeat protein
MNFLREGSDFISYRMPPMSAVEAVLRQPNFDVNQRDEFGCTLLTYATEIGHLDLIELLLEHPNIDTNCKDCNGKTPLVLAAENDHSEAVTILRSLDESPGPRLILNDPMSTLGAPHISTSRQASRQVRIKGFSIIFILRG